MVLCANGCGRPAKASKTYPSKYCSKACKQAAYRLRLKGNAVFEKSNKLYIVPCSIEEANQFTKQYHRHLGSIVVARFALAVSDEQGHIHGVAIVGLPLSQKFGAFTLEVRRCTTDGTRNACSMLYGACWKTARALGYRRLITYTLPEEGGASLRAVGWKPTTGCGGKPWNSKKRKRDANPLYLLKKTRWEMVDKQALPFSATVFPAQSEQPQQSLFEQQEGGVV